MRKAKIALGLTLVACAVVLVSLRNTAAQNAGVSLSAQFSTGDILRMAAANALKVNVNLKSGAQYSAKVKEVGAAAVVLTQPTGKEFYDVYMPFEAIAAIELKVRDK